MHTSTPVFVLAEIIRCGQSCHDFVSLITGTFFVKLRYPSVFEFYIYFNSIIEASHISGASYPRRFTVVAATLESPYAPSAFTQ